MEHKTLIIQYPDSADSETVVGAIFATLSNMYEEQHILSAMFELSKNDDTDAKIAGIVNHDVFNDQFRTVVVEYLETIDEPKLINYLTTGLSDLRHDGHVPVDLTLIEDPDQVATLDQITNSQSFWKQQK